MKDWKYVIVLSNNMAHLGLDHICGTDIGLHIFPVFAWECFILLINMLW